MFDNMHAHAHATCMQGEVEMAMSMYQELHRWEDAIAVAAARVRPVQYIPSVTDIFPPFVN